MPWKPTKLKYFGVAVRRRTLYALTVFFAVAVVPTASWALLVSTTNLDRQDKVGYYLLAGVVAVAAFRGWWMIMHHHPVLYRDEARILWPGAAVLLALAVWAGCQVSVTAIKAGRLSYVAPLALGGLFLIYILIRCCTLGRYLKRGDIVRGDGGSRRSSRSGKPGNTPSPLAEAELDDVEENEEIPAETPRE